MTLGENLQRLRKEKGLSQEEVAQALFVSRQSVSKWETDKAEPGVDNLKALANLYEVTLDQLTGRTQVEYTHKDGEKKTPMDQYRTMALIRLALWLVLVMVGQLLEEESGSLQFIAFVGMLGSMVIGLSLWIRNIYVWGGILCAEVLSILVAVFCAISAESLPAGMASIALAAMLCFWIKYLSSELVRQLFCEKKEMFP